MDEELIARVEAMDAMLVKVVDQLRHQLAINEEVAASFHSVGASLDVLIGGAAVDATWRATVLRRLDDLEAAMEGHPKARALRTGELAPTLVDHIRADLEKEGKVKARADTATPRTSRSPGAGPPGSSTSG